MKILMLGNGFDLYHDLPTTYLCFLKTVDYIVKNDVSKETSLGQMFNCLKNDCSQIERSYNSHKIIYDNAFLPSTVLARIKEIGKNNDWFKYFIDTYNKDVGWIDIETEIEMVVQCIEKALPKLSSEKIYNIDRTTSFVLSCFSFFTKRNPSSYNDGKGALVISPNSIFIKNEYKIEYPLGSGVYCYDYDRIINELYSKLREFVELLELYLLSFVDNLINESISIESNPLRNIILMNEAESSKKDNLVISLNYTHILEKAYGFQEESIIHIHGSLGNNDIVLGVNSNAVTENNYTLKFRKYYQRTMYDTDEGYNNFLFNTRTHICNDINDLRASETIHLFVFGHSLDVSDRDIIESLFARAEIIEIYYYDEKSKDQYIRNLITIFGKNEFELLRINKCLSFRAIKNNG